MLDPCKSEVRLKLHWLPYHMPDGVVRTPLEAYGKVEHITRNTWKLNGFVGVQSTTMLVRLSLKTAVGLDQLPHQLRILGGTAFVVVPGRAPLCLRRKITGHIRKDCRVPRCDECRRFGHHAEDCARTYATAVNRGRSEDTAKNQMDEVEAERVAQSATLEAEVQSTAVENRRAGNGSRCPSVQGRASASY